MASLENMSRKEVIANLLKDSQRDIQAIETFFTEMEQVTDLTNCDWEKMSEIFERSVRPQYKNQNWKEKIPALLENDKKTLMTLCALLNKVKPELNHKDRETVERNVAKAQMLIYGIDKLLIRLKNDKVIFIDDWRK